MQKQIKKIATLFASATVVFTAIAADLPASKVAIGVPDSIVTVDQLVSIENAAARESAKKSAIDTGAIQPVPKFRRGEGPMTSFAPRINVHSISGVGGLNHVDMSYNGVRFPDLKIGSKVDSCYVASIRGACVVLDNSPKEVPKIDDAKKQNSSKKNKKSLVQEEKNPVDMCPTTCWTGISPAQTNTSPGAPSSAMPLPMNVPGGPLPAQSGSGYMGQQIGSMPSQNK